MSQLDVAKDDVEKVTPSVSSHRRTLIYLIGLPGTPAAMLLFLLFFVAVIRSPQLLGADGLRIAFAVMTPLALAAMAITLPAIAGRGGIDLSVGPLMAFVNCTIVVWLVSNGISSPIAVVGWALLCGFAIGALQGFLVSVLRVQPVIVTLSGFLILSGLSLSVLPVNGGSVPSWLGELSRNLVIGPLTLPIPLLVLLAACGLWLALRPTALMRQIRILGSNERMAYTSGIPVIRIRVAAYAIGGLYGGLAGLMVTALLSSGQPGQGTLYTISALTALVLGGTSLAGGSGGMLLSLMGAANIFLIQYVLGSFDFGKLSGFVVQFSYGAILVFALILGVAAPRFISRRFGQ